MSIVTHFCSPLPQLPRQRSTLLPTTPHIPIASHEVNSLRVSKVTMSHETQTQNPEEQGWGGPISSRPLLASIQVWARGLIYMAGLEPLAEESAQIVLYVLLIIKPPLQAFLPPLVCVSIWSKFKQRFRPCVSLV